ncbi:hypothetical protein OQA88_5762 [Cercophora sp. LCS_1]
MYRYPGDKNERRLLRIIDRVGRSVHRYGLEASQESKLRSKQVVREWEQAALTNPQGLVEIGLPWLEIDSEDDDMNNFIENTGFSSGTEFSNIIPSTRASARAPKSTRRKSGDRSGGRRPPRATPQLVAGRTGDEVLPPATPAHGTADDDAEGEEGAQQGEAGE